MADIQRIITMVRLTLQRPNEEVGRLISLRTFPIGWLILLIISGLGAYDFYFGLF
jgi:hypothetical protein